MKSCEYVQLFILLSCSLAVFCNMSQYLCIGRFSAVSFQVLGHMKTVCVLTLGWLLFDSALTFKNIMGMFLAVLGMVIYSWAVESEKRSNNKTLSHTKNSLTEEEIRLLKEGVETGPVKDVELGESKAQVKKHIFGQHLGGLVWGKSLFVARNFMYFYEFQFILFCIYFYLIRRQDSGVRLPTIHIHLRNCVYV